MDGSEPSWTGTGTDLLTDRCRPAPSSGCGGRRGGRDGGPYSRSLIPQPGEEVMRVDVTVDISAPPEVVWAVLSDVESWPTWTASITSIRLLGPDPLQVGSRVRIRQPRLPATVWTVSDFVEGERFSWTSTSPGVNTRASHRVVGTAEGSRATR